MLTASAIIESKTKANRGSGRITLEPMLTPVAETSILTDDDLDFVGYSSAKLKLMGSEDAILGHSPLYPKSQPYMDGYRQRVLQGMLGTAEAASHQQDEHFCWSA